MVSLRSMVSLCSVDGHGPHAFDAQRTDIGRRRDR